MIIQYHTCVVVFLLLVVKSDFLYISVYRKCHIEYKTPVPLLSTVRTACVQRGDVSGSEVRDP